MKENDLKKSSVIKVNRFTITAVSVDFTLLFYQIVCSMHKYVQTPWNECPILNYQPFLTISSNSTKWMTHSIL